MIDCFHEGLTSGPVISSSNVVLYLSLKVLRNQFVCISSFNLCFYDIYLKVVVCLISCLEMFLICIFFSVYIDHISFKYFQHCFSNTVFSSLSTLEIFLFFLILYIHLKMKNKYQCLCSYTYLSTIWWATLKLDKKISWTPIWQ